LAPVTGERENSVMKREHRYADAPEDISEAILTAAEVGTVIPPPEMLIPKEETRKVTIALSKKSLDFFKETAKKTRIPYQQMIRKVLDMYTDHYAE
jgi:hypothetical protein